MVTSPLASAGSVFVKSSAVSTIPIRVTSPALGCLAKYDSTRPLVAKDVFRF